MKNTNLLLAILFLFGSLPVQAQDTWKERANVLVFAQNENELHTTSNSQNINLFANYSIYKKNNWMIGPFVMASLSRNENYSGYKGRIKEVGGGIGIGRYIPKLSEDFAAWWGIDVGVKWNKDAGDIRTMWGLYNGEQTGSSLTASLGFNLWRRNMMAILPRTQIQLTGQFPVSQTKKGYWNGELILDKMWDREFVEFSIKQSITNIPIAISYLSPKVVVIYSHAQGNQENTFGLGVEMSLHKAYRDDYLSFNCLYKISNYQDRISIGVVLNIPAFF